MAYSSHLEISIGTTAAERDLARFQNRLELTDRAGDGVASSVNNVGVEVDRMRNMVMRASGVLTGSAAAFGLMARQSSDAAREIKNLSRLAGADVVAFQKMTMASRQFGIEQDQLAQIMLDVKDRVGDFLQTGQGEFADFFENIAPKVGLTADALARMAGPEALQAIYNALEQTNLTASETTFYMESLASDATRLIPLLKDNGAGFREVAVEAERLGVALSEVEIDQLTALRGEFADLEAVISGSTSQIIAAYSGEIAATVDSLGEGAMLLADNFDTLADAATLAAGVMTARFVSAMAAGTASIASSIAATRAQTISIAENQAMEATRAATLARTTAAEQAAAAQRASIAAQRAAQDRAAIAQDAQRLASTQASLAAERALETQRLQAQISAQGRMMSATRLAEIRASETAITNQLTAANVRLTEAEIAETSAKRASSLADVEKARSATAATAAVNAAAAASARAAASSGALAASARAASGALSLVGGPVGAAVLAGAAAYYFRDSLGFASEAARETAQEIDELTGSLENYTQAQYENSRVSIVQDLAEARIEASKLQDQIASLQEQSQQESIMYQGRPGASSGQLSGLMADLQEQNRIISANEEGLREYDQAWKDVLQSQISGVSIFRTLDQWLMDTGDSANNASTQFDALNYTLGTGGEKWDDYIGKLTAARDVLGMTAAEAANYSAVQQGFTGLYAEQAGAVAGQTAALEDYRSAVQEGNSVEAAAHLERAQRYAEAEAMVLAQLQNIDTLTNLLKGVQTELSATALSAALVVGGSAGNVSTMLANAVAAINERASAIQRTTTVTVKNTAANRAAEAAERERTRALDDSISAYADLFAELSPVGAAQAEYNETVARLTVAYEAGTKSAIEYYAAIGQAAAMYNEAVAAADPNIKRVEELSNQYDRAYVRGQQLTTTIDDINAAYRRGDIDGAQYTRMMGNVRDEMAELALEADPMAQEMARAWEEATNRIDETFSDAFAGAFDSFDSFADSLLDGFKRLLAELAYQATLKPIVVQFTQQMGGALGIPGVGGQGGGGFNLSSLGSLKNGWDTVSGLFGGGSAASGGLYSNALTGSAAAGGLYSSAATGAAQGGLYGNALTGGVASGAGGLSSMMAAAGPALAIYAAASAGDSLLKNVGAYDALGIRTDGRSSQFLSQFMPIGGTVIGSALDAIGIGGRKTAPKFELATVGQDVDPTRHGLFENYGEGVYSRGALGTVGFYDPNTARLEETFDGFDNAKAFLDGITALDNAMVGAAANLDNGAEKTQAMASAAQAVRLNAGDAAGIADQLATRTLAVVDVLDGDFSASLRGLGLDAEQITGRVVQAANAMQLLDASSARLNLQFDANAAGAMRAADGMAQLMGGADNLNASLGSFYDTFYTEEEKLQHLTEDLSGTFASMGRELPTTREGVRELVEGLELMGTAGQEQLATILQTTPALREYITAMEAQNNVVNDSAAIAEERWRLENELLEAQGRDAELLARTRERELSSIDESNRALQERIWALQDETAAQQAANERTELLNRASLYSSGIVSGVDDALDAYNEQMQLASEVAQQREQQLQSEMQAVQQLGNLLDSLMLSNQSILDPAERLQEAQRQFAELSVRAENGDTAAAGQLDGASSAYLDAAAAYYGQSSGQYANIFNDVTGSIGDLEDRFGESIATLGSIESIEKQMLREQQRARDMLSSSLSEQVQQSNLLGSIADLIELLPDSLGSAIASALPEQAPSSGGSGGFDEAAYLANKTEQVNSIGQGGRSNWTPEQVLDAIIRDYGSIEAHYEQIGRSEGVQPFANGGAFTNGIVSAPTMFDMGVMGEAGSEAIMPLANIGGSLGVNVAGAVDLEPLTRELAALRQEVAMLRSERRNDASVAADQRNKQIGEQKKINKNVKLKERVS